MKFCSKCGIEKPDDQYWRNADGRLRSQCKPCGNEGSAIWHKTHPRKCYFDSEWYSDVPINYGSYKYAEGAEILLVTYAFNDEPVKIWDCIQDPKIPNDLQEAFVDPKVRFIMHNSAFDQIELREVCGIDIPVERIDDTMTRARTVGLPGSLGTLCSIFKIPNDKAKDKRGRELIRLFCIPRPKNSKIRRATHVTHPKEWEQFKEYAASDVEAMRAIDRVCPRWNLNERETALWHLDRKINDKGLCVDTDLAYAAISAIGRTKETLNAATSKATGGVVRSATQRDQLIRFILGAYGIALPDLQAATLERRLNDPEIPQGVRELISQRLQICTTSTAKYQTLLNCVSKDRRLRGTIEFCGAGRTGRYAGRKFQPQNLPSRGLMPQHDIDRGIKLLKYGAAELVYDDIMKLTSSCIRGAIVAPGGSKLTVSDLSNIEGRAAAWLAGEEWKLQAYRDFDAGIGPDLYVMAYARAFNVDPATVTKEQRQIGKVMELMLQYEGGVGAFLTGAATYGIDLAAMADAAYPNIPPRILRDAKEFWHWAVKRHQHFGLEEKVFVVCDALKRMWREAHPAISSYWPELGATIEKAFDQPGYYHPCRKVKMRKAGSWLLIILPSGRSLCYAAPKYEYKKFSYMGVDAYTKQWKRLSSYGGKEFENITQGVARDFMTHNMPIIDKAGYEIVLTCHDEVVTETPDNDEFSVEHLSEMLAANPPWALDIPLAADGFEGYRYRK